MTQLEKAFKAFQKNPSSENGWKLQQEMVAFANSTASVNSKAISEKPSSTKKLKTCKGGKWDAKLAEIIELFNALEWEITSGKGNAQIETWNVTSKNGDRALLGLDSSGFSMFGNLSKSMTNIPLKGDFEGYDDIEVFHDFLVSNGIEIDD